MFLISQIRGQARFMLSNRVCIIKVYFVFLDRVSMLLFSKVQDRNACIRFIRRF